MNALLQGLALICVLGTAMVSGVFFAYSTFTMDGLRSLSPSQGVAAMQAINRAAPKWTLLSLLFGTGMACLTLVVYAALHLGNPDAHHHLVGGCLYLAGVILVTGGYHVPRNNRLESLESSSAEAETYWTIYLREWVRMNHVRTIASLLSATLFAVSL